MLSTERLPSSANEGSINQYLPQMDGDEHRIGPNQKKAIQDDIRNALAPYTPIIGVDNYERPVRECDPPEHIVELWGNALLDASGTILNGTAKGRRLGEIYVGAGFMAAPTNTDGTRVFYAQSLRNTSYVKVAQFVRDVASIAAGLAGNMPYGPDGFLWPRDYLDFKDDLDSSLRQRELREAELKLARVKDMIPTRDTAPIVCRDSTASTLQERMVSQIGYITTFGIWSDHPPYQATVVAQAA